MKKKQDQDVKDKQLTKREVSKIIRWCQKKLKLQDYEIILYYQKKPPWFCKPGDEDFAYGACETNIVYKHAKIWIQPDREKRDGLSTIRSICHEMLELSFHDACIDHDTYDLKHSLIETLCVILEAAYDNLKQE